MSISAGPSLRSERRPGLRLGRPAPPAGAWIALALYLIATALFFGKPLLPHPGSTTLGIGTDPVLFQWGYAWWPHAILHGLNPFYTHLLYAPSGANVAQATMVPGPAIVMWPVTAIWGPLVAFDASEVLAPALAAWTTFLLCRRLIVGAPVDAAAGAADKDGGTALADRARAYRQAFLPALVGGWLFGFSSYLLGQLEGHEQLTIVFLIPVLVHLAVRAYAGELSTRRTVLWLTLALIGTFSVGEELFASFTVFAAVTFVAGYLFAGADARTRLRAVLPSIVIAYVITAIIVSPFLYYSLKPGGEPVSYDRSAIISGDLLGLIVPTQIARVLGQHYLTTTAHFFAGFIEGGNYFGIPLLVLFAIGLWWSRRRPWMRVLAVVALVALVLSLGPYLHIDGHKYVHLPWWALERLPLLGLVLPARLVMYMWLAVAIAVAVTLGGVRSPVRGLLAYGLAAAAVVSLWPAVNMGYWHTDPPIPKLFSTDAYRQVIKRGQTVLITPVGSNSYANLWQAQTDFYFTLAGGYVLPEEAPNTYQKWPIYPTLIGGTPVPDELAAARYFIARHHITLAVIADTDLPDNPWPRILHRLGWSSRSEDGALVLRPPSR